jgi:hypothetical protein
MAEERRARQRSSESGVRGGVEVWRAQLLAERGCMADEAGAPRAGTRRYLASLDLPVAGREGPMLFRSDEPHPGTTATQADCSNFNAEAPFITSNPIHLSRHRLSAPSSCSSSTTRIFGNQPLHTSTHFMSMERIQRLLAAQMGAGMPAQVHTIPSLSLPLHSIPLTWFYRTQTSSTTPKPSTSPPSPSSRCCGTAAPAFPWKSWA